MGLAQEVRIIRRLEQRKRKWKKRLNPAWTADPRVAGVRKYVYKENKAYAFEKIYDLWAHRTKTVKPLARASHLALGYLRNVPYRAMENLALSSPNWVIVWKDITKLGGIEDTKENQDKFMEWADVVPTSKTQSNQPARDYADFLQEPKPSILIKAIFQKRS